MKLAIANDDLASGVTVYRDSPGDDPGWLELSAGSEPSGGEVASGVPYAASAVVPAERWRRPSSEERDRLLAPRDQIRAGFTVSVLRISERVLAPLRRATIGRAITAQGGPVNAAENARERDEALLYLSPYIASREDLVIHGLRVQVGGLRTATAHPLPEGLAFIGLHIDRWHQGDYGCTEHAQLSINVGARDRFFAFYNLPVTRLAAIYGQPDEGWLTIGRDLARAHPRYPLVRVRLRPGEAYLAPTENLVHDVTLTGSDRPDICFNLRGRFRIPA